MMNDKLATAEDGSVDPNNRTATPSNGITNANNGMAIANDGVSNSGMANANNLVVFAEPNDALIGDYQDSVNFP